MPDCVKRRSLTRRAFLRLAGLAGIGTVLSACGAPPTPLPEGISSPDVVSGPASPTSTRPATVPTVATPARTAPPTVATPTPTPTPMPTRTATPTPTDRPTPTATATATRGPLRAISLIHGPSRALVMDYVLQRLGILGTTVRVDLGETVPDLTTGAYDAILFAGGEYRPDEFEKPIFQAERERIMAALEARVPILGICLGNQLIAHWLGGQVTAGKWEIGWLPVTVNDAGLADPLLAGLGDTFHAFLWHGDRVSQLPENAVLLASSELCPVQAFRLRDLPVWGVQFNPQYDPVIAEGVIRAAKTLSSHGYDIEEMVATGYREYNDLAGKLFGNFFAQVTGIPSARITETPGMGGETFREER
jgi:GMP synthase (glutamine-hydrolysing)